LAPVGRKQSLQVRDYSTIGVRWQGDLKVLLEFGTALRHRRMSESDMGNYA
jgi:hypothetical protein